MEMKAITVALLVILVADSSQDFELSMTKFHREVYKAERSEGNTDFAERETSNTYQPTWESLDARPLPAWYDQAKFGIFIHWGVFSVPSYYSEWFWWYWQGKPKQRVVDFMKDNFRPGFTYADFAPLFTAEFFNPNQWADLFKESGAQYTVFTTKHHEGFTNWPSSRAWNWNAMDVGPHRDIVGELAVAIRNRTDLHFGLYHSMFEWFNPYYLADKTNNFTTRDFPNLKTMPELYDIVNTYKPELVWSDAAHGPTEYWNSTGFLAWLYNESPVKDYVVVNDRWGSDTTCKHGGYYTCGDRFNPGILQTHKWENTMTIDKTSWGYRRNATIEDYLTIEEIISTLASTISCGGNMLMNVGPTHDGVIAPIFQERLKQIGSWLKVNGEAVYSTKPWSKGQNDSLTPNVWYTAKDSSIYAIVLSWPKQNILELALPTPDGPQAEIKMLGLDQQLEWSYGGKVLDIAMPVLSVSDLPCQWAWALKLNGFK